MRPMTADPSVSARSRLPGPGKYNIEPKDVKVRGFSCGTNKRKTFIDEAIKKSETPAPGVYNGK